jgi:hypothetical protein
VVDVEVVSSVCAALSQGLVVLWPVGVRLCGRMTAPPTFFCEYGSIWRIVYERGEPLVMQRRHVVGSKNDDDDDADTKQPPRPKVAPAQAKPRLKGINEKRLGAIDYSLLAERATNVSDK